MKTVKRSRWFFAKAVIFWGFVGLLLVLFWPISPVPLTYPATTVPTSYEAAVMGLQKLVDETPANIREDARLQYLVHGVPTEHVYVLIHGLSNNPRQFAKLGQLLYERGANVVIPRLPYHGEKNRMATEWAHLTGQQMIDNAAEAVALAKGLGRHVTVVGLSISGTTAGWLAQQRSDVDRAVLMAPFFAPYGIPTLALTPISRTLGTLPNFFVWWNPKYKENLPGPDYVYPRFPTKIIGQVIEMGAEVHRDSQAKAPQSPEILVITTAVDVAGNNALTAQVVEQWRSHQGKVQTYEFPADQKVPHDFIDPNQPDQQVDIVYPKLMELLEGK